MADRDASEPHLLLVGACSRETGGISQYIRGQANHLSEHARVTVHSTSSPCGKSALSAGIIPKYRWLALAVLSALVTFLRFPTRNRPDVVHVHASSRLSFYRESLYVLFAAFVWGCPVVCHVHGSDFDAFLLECGPGRMRYVRWVFGACETVVVLSPYWADVLAEEAGVDHTEVVPNPVEVETFDWTEPGDTPHVVYLSNLIERKGVVEFVEAVERLGEREGPPFEVTIAGDGAEAHHVERLADERENVTYLGYVTERRKRALLADADVYVLPTYAEGLPISLLEAMAAGNAVISTEVGAIPEVVNEDNGILISPVDVGELVEGLQALRTNERLRRQMARNNRRLIREAYSWDVITGRLLDLYGQLLARENLGRSKPEVLGAQNNE